MRLFLTITVRNKFEPHFEHALSLRTSRFSLPDQPHNPMVNSGAIMSASILLYLVRSDLNVAQKYDYVFDFFKVGKSGGGGRELQRKFIRPNLVFQKMAGGEYLGFNNSIFLSEVSTNAGRSSRQPPAPRATETPGPIYAIHFLTIMRRFPANC